MDHVLWSFGQELALNDILKAANCSLYDSKGQRYIDLESGVWSTAIGHSHPRIVQKIQEQCAKISHTGYCYANPIIDETAKEILSLLDFKKGKCSFLCSGSEAVEFGVRIAQTISEKPLLLSFSSSYFGSYGAARNKNEKEWYCFDWLKHCSDCLGSEGCDPNCEHILRIPFAQIGGFVFEPGSSDLIKFPPQQLVLHLANTVQHNNGFLIVNEVTTGFGRTGKWFGYQHYDLKPDIVAMGKGLGSGYPVSSVALSEKVMARLDPGFYYCQSHQNDALGAAIAREVIQVIKDENLIERSARIGTNLIKRLRELSARFPMIKEVRGRGLMIGIEFVDPANRKLIAAVVHRELLKKGFIVSNRSGYNFIRLDPSLTIAEEDLESFLQSLEQILTSLS